LHDICRLGAVIMRLESRVNALEKLLRNRKVKR
jgi:hypothetical protein